MRRFRFADLIVLFCLLVPALLRAQASSEDAAATAQPEPAAYVDAARFGPLRFKPCAENPALECGTLNVPVNYRHPDGPTVGLAVIRAKALDPGRRIGVLFAHTGGHASGVDFVLGAHPAPAFVRLRQRFDVVSLDPRGAGRSRPFKCGFDVPGPPAGHSDAVLISSLDDYAQRVAQQCLDHDRSFVLSITGNNFARDIDALRRALGEQQLSFAMISNSGPVAGVYASLFPRHVRAMLIDSPVAPEFDDYWIERPSEQSASYETVLRHIDQLCRRDPACRLRSTGVVAAYDKVASRLQAAPVTTSAGDLFDSRRLSTTFFNLLPDESLWPFVVEALANALAGDYTIFFQLAALDSAPRSSDAIVARLCNDYGTRRTAADYLPIAQAVDAVYPHFFPRFEIALQTAECALWPQADAPVIRDVAQRLDLPAMLIGSEFDSDAPFPWTKRLARAMGSESAIVRYQGGGHGLASRSELPCIADVIDAYLFNLQLPAKATHCAAAPIAFGAAALQAATQSAAEPVSMKRWTPRFGR
jgi:pimeloyl-ACP methyl ester carboxylesterase